MRMDNSTAGLCQSRTGTWCVRGNSFLIHCCRAMNVSLKLLWALDAPMPEFRAYSPSLAIDDQVKRGSLSLSKGIHTSSTSLKPIQYFVLLPHIVENMPEEPPCSPLEPVTSEEKKWTVMGPQKENRIAKSPVLQALQHDVKSACCPISVTPPPNIQTKRKTLMTKNQNVRYKEIWGSAPPKRPGISLAKTKNKWEREKRDSAYIVIT